MAKLRCRPGDLAIIIRCSRKPELIGRIVTVGSFVAQADQWEILLTGAPAFGLGFRDGCPVISHEWLAPDSFLQPLRGAGEIFQEMLREVAHG